MSCSLAQAGQGRLVPADGAIQDQSRDWISWSSLFRNIHSLEISYWMWDMIHTAEVRGCQFTWNSEQTRADLARLRWAHQAECGDFEACKIPQLANMGIKRGLPAWDCAMSIPHTDSVRVASYAFIDFSFEFYLWYFSLYLICFVPQICVREINLALH